MAHGTAGTASQCTDRTDIMSRLIDIKEVGRMTSLSRATIYRKFNAAEDFPKPLTLPSTRRIVWVEAEVAAWIMKQIALARAV
jgi:predicted DNA-binding transcriptional regulator AlpA